MDRTNYCADCEQLQTRVTKLETENKRLSDTAVVCLPTEDLKQRVIVAEARARDADACVAELEATVGRVRGAMACPRIGTAEERQAFERAMSLIRHALLDSSAKDDKKGKSDGSR